MDFRIIHSAQVGLVLNHMTGSIASYYLVVYDDKFCTVVSINISDTELWIRLVTSSLKKLVKYASNIIPLILINETENLLLLPIVKIYRSWDNEYTELDEE